ARRARTPPRAGGRRARAASTRRLQQLVRHLDLHPEEVRGVRLPLRVELERDGPAAAERLVQQEVQRAEVRQLEPLDLAPAHRAEVGLDALGGDGVAEE